MMGLTKLLHLLILSCFLPASLPQPANPPGAFDSFNQTVYLQASRAYSTRKLFQAYNGPQLQVRRSKDDQIVDIYMDMYGNIVKIDGTTDSINTWSNSSFLFVSKWYDQSPNSQHATTDSANQPNFVWFQDKWVVQFNGYNQRLQFANLDVMSVWSVFYVNQLTNAFFTLFGAASADKSLRIPSDNNGDDWFKLGALWWMDNVVRAKSNSGLYLPNGVRYWSTLTAVLSTSYAISMNEMGKGSVPSPARGLNGYMAEMILFNTRALLNTHDQFYNLTAPLFPSSVPVIPRNGQGALDSLDEGLYQSSPYAYSCRRLFGVYRGPQIRVRRSSDNAEVDVYMDKFGNITQVTGTFDTWDRWSMHSNNLFVAIWYDQASKGFHATTGASDQPNFVKFQGEWVVQFNGNNQRLQFFWFDVMSVWSVFYVNQYTNGYLTLFGAASADKSLRIPGDNNADDWFRSNTGSLWWMDKTTQAVSDIAIYLPNGLRVWNTFSAVLSSSYSTLMNEMGKGSVPTPIRGLDGYMKEILLFNNRTLLPYHDQLHAVANLPVLTYSASWENHTTTMKPVITQGALDPAGDIVFKASYRAYSVRRLFDSYTGPQLRIRRSLDDSEIDLYLDKCGRIINLVGTNGTFGNWSMNSTLFVTTWYDQSLRGLHARTDAPNQPNFVYFQDEWAVQFNGNNQRLQFSQVNAMSVWSVFYVNQYTNGYITLFGAASADKSLRIPGENNVNDWFRRNTGSLWWMDKTFQAVSNTAILLPSGLRVWNTLTAVLDSSYSIMMNEIGKGSVSTPIRGLNGYMKEMIFYNTKSLLQTHDIFYDLSAKIKNDTQSYDYQMCNDYCSPEMYKQRSPFRCLPCPANAVCDSNNYQCMAGYESNPSGNGCQQCPFGKYKPTTSTSICLDCPPGFMGMTVGAINCTRCLTGFYKSAGMSICNQCPLNSNCNTTGFICNAGFELSSNGTTCVPCSPSRFRPTMMGSHYCSTCPIGTDSKSANGLGCDLCSNGKFRPSLNYTDGCVDCPNGAICTPFNLTCLAGYTPNLNVEFLCDTCPNKYYKSKDGNELCDPCPVNLFSSDDFQFCVLCPEGQYLVPAGECAKCPIGKEPNFNRTFCVECPTGKYKTSSMNRCANCPTGATCSLSEFKCNPGFALNVWGNGCRRCDAGYIKQLSGNTECPTQCPLGTESNVDRTECVNCKPGSFRDKIDIPYCRACPIGSTCELASFTCLQGWEKTQSGDACKETLNDINDFNTLNTATKTSTTNEHNSNAQGANWFSSVVFVSTSVTIGCLIIVVLIMTCFMGWKRFQASEEAKFGGYLFRKTRQPETDLRTDAVLSSSMENIVQGNQTETSLEYVQDK